MPREPKHIAIIMDGNGRYAQKLGKPRTFGHKKGVTALQKIIEECLKRGIQSLTVFAFSSENFKRPKEEVHFLMHLFFIAIRRYRRSLLENGIRFRAFGDFSKLPTDLQKELAELTVLTEKNQTLNFNLMINYSGKWDILNAVKKVSSPTEITEQNFEKNLALFGQPRVDLVIRTSGELRLSNFLLWQIAYSEFYFTERFWPEFTPRDLQEAIKSYQNRHRRFGGLEEKKD